MSTEPIRDADNRGYQRIGRYELLGEIASGGMATVFLGRAVGVKGFSRLVAIKRLHPHLEREEDFVSAFLDEARLAARIRHPNVVPTLDVDDRDGLYIVMEYVEGDRMLGLLRHAVKANEPIPVGIAFRIAIEALAGLHAAHDLLDDDGAPLNLVHRDVSPQNVLIGIDGVTKITDFGIAKAESRLVTTRDGQLKGKIAYMAPEQARGGGIDRRVDVFAMGILVWEMLSSRRLFKGDNDVEVLSAVLSNPIPSLRSVLPSVPEEVDAVVMRALDRDPAGRYDSASDFADALEAIAHVVGGVASTRTVAQYVQRVAGPKLEAERERVKQGVSIAGVKEAPSSPSSPSRSFNENRGSGVSSVRSLAADSLQGVPLDSERPVASASKRTLIISGIATLAAITVGAAVMLTRNPSPPNRAASPTTVQTTPQPATGPATPTTSPVAANSGTTPTNAVPPVPVQPPTPTVAATAPTPTRPSVNSNTRRPNTGRTNTRRPTGPAPAGDNDDDSIAINPYRH